MCGRLCYEVRRSKVHFSLLSDCRDVVMLRSRCLTSEQGVTGLTPQSRNNTGPVVLMRVCLSQSSIVR